MKNNQKLMLRKLFVLLFIAVNMAAYGQNGKKAFETNEIIWCGIDFSEARFVGSQGFNDRDKLVSYYLDQWNLLMINEPDKYDFAKAYKKESQKSDLSVVNRRNELDGPEGIVIDESYELESGKIEGIIKDYDLEKYQEGVGLAYIVSSFDKIKQRGHTYVVFFDIATKEILWSKLITSKAMGFGFRNYWAGAIYGAMGISGSDFKNAKKEFEKAEKKK